MIRFCSLLLILISTNLISQPLAHPFRFTIPLKSDIKEDSLLLTSQESLDTSDVVQVRQGHFVDMSGKRVKLIGTLLSYAACFPDSGQAIRLARRWHDLGLNCVRMRGWDYTNPVYGGYFLPKPSVGTDTSFQQDYVKKFDWFLYQLKLNGIYVFLTNMAFLPRDVDKVNSSDSINYSWNVRVFQFVDPQYQAAQKRFLRGILSHVNPYTKTALKDDPTIAMMTCTDENSLSAYWANDFIEGTTNLLPSYQRRYLDSSFNKYLIAKYSNDNGLTSAWSYGNPDGTNRIADPGFEDLFTSPWQPQINTANAQAAFISSDADKVEGSRSAVFKVNKSGASIGDIQLFLFGIRVQKGKQYRLKFWSKASNSGHPIVAYLLRGSTPYNGYGLSSRFALTTSWAEYSAAFTCNSTDDNGLFILQLGGSAGDVYLDKFSLVEEAAPVFQAGESLSKFNVSTRISGKALSVKRTMETVDFLNELQEKYYTSMKRFIQDTLRSHILVGGSLWTQSLSDVYTSRNLDFTSCHGYRGYFALAPDGTKTDPYANPWYLQTNQLEAQDAGAGNVNVFGRSHIRNIPLVIGNEFHIYPSKNHNELLSYLPMYAALQDADAYFFGDWDASNSATTLDSAWITKTGFWEVKSQFALQSLIPSISTMWKQSLVKPASDVIRINYNREQRSFPAWQQAGNYLLEPCDARMSLFRRIEIDSFDAKNQSVLPHLVIPEFNAPGGLDMSHLESDTKEILWNQTDGWLKVSTPRFIAATGRLNNVIQTFNECTVEKSDAAPYATFTWLSSDTNSIATSENSLITMSVKSQNLGAVCDGDSTLWRGWGGVAVESEGAIMRFGLKSDYDSLFVVALDTLAEPNGLVISATKTKSGRFNFELDQARAKAMWFRVEQKRVTSRVETVHDNESIDVSPNPADQRVLLEFSSEARLRCSSVQLLNLQGTEIQNIDPQGRDLVTFDTQSLPAGTYLIKICLGNDILVRKVIIQH